MKMNVLPFPDTVICFFIFLPDRNGVFHRELGTIIFNTMRVSCFSDDPGIAGNVWFYKPLSHFRPVTLRNEGNKRFSKCRACIRWHFLFHFF